MTLLNSIMVCEQLCKNYDAKLGLEVWNANVGNNRYVMTSHWTLNRCRILMMCVLNFSNPLAIKSCRS